MDGMEEFEKEVLGNAPEAVIREEPTEAFEEDPKEAWETMPIKELRKYYKTQIEERRAREASYIEQRDKCKKIREFMKKVII